VETNKKYLFVLTDTSDCGSELKEFEGHIKIILSSPSKRDNDIRAGYGRVPIEYK
jgi:hypothetical protein